jgi:hypothetical protein
MPSGAIPPFPGKSAENRYRNVLLGSAIENYYLPVAYETD